MLRFENNTIRCNRADVTLWSYPLDALRVVAEYTTDAGPFDDDFFAVFGFADGAVKEVSFARRSAIDAYLAIQKALGIPLTDGLVGSTGFASRIMWPARLAGQPMFEWVPDGDASRARTAGPLSGLMRWEARLTDVAARALSTGSV